MEKKKMQTKRTTTATGVLLGLARQNSERISRKTEALIERLDEKQPQKASEKQA